MWWCPTRRWKGPQKWKKRSTEFTDQVVRTGQDLTTDGLGEWWACRVWNTVWCWALLPHSLLKPGAQWTRWFIIQDFCSGHAWQPQEGNPLPLPTLEGVRWSIPRADLHMVFIACVFLFTCAFPCHFSHVQNMNGLLWLYRPQKSLYFILIRKMDWTSFLWMSPIGL